MSRFVLGLSAFYHDSAAVLLKDGKICAAAQEERFTRVKHDPGYPQHAVAYVLSHAGILPSDLEAVAFYDKPGRKFVRLLKTYLAYAPRGLKSFLPAMDAWLSSKLFIKSKIRSQLSRMGPGKPPIFFPEHHLSHAASAFYPSPFQEAAVLTIDGVGEWTTTSLGFCAGNRLKILREIHFPHSLGLLYSAFTAYCGFKVNSGEYKLMGLSPYADPHSKRVKQWIDLILTNMMDLRPDGSFRLNMAYFNYPSGLTMCHDDKWRELLGIAPRQPESALLSAYLDMAQAAQQVCEETLFRLAATAKRLTGAKNIVMAGGVALNCVANGKLHRRQIFDGMWVQPAAGDAGGALGAAMAAWHIGLGQSRQPTVGFDAMGGAFLGPSFSGQDVKTMCAAHQAVFDECLDDWLLCRRTAKLLAQGNVIGWFQGRMEYGPRALGARSILGDPRDPQMQRKINQKIKFREGFRPFAPSVLEDDVQQWFDLNVASPYMLMVAPVAKHKQLPLPPDYTCMEVFERVNTIRSDIPAVTHVDYSARIHTVNRKTNPIYWQLLSEFRKLTGCGVLINTSFNVRGEPIVCTPEDAYACFMRTEMDCLIINRLILKKADQPPLLEGEAWKNRFAWD